MKLLYACLFLLALCASLTSWSQCGSEGVYCIEDGYVYTCSGIFMDAGGNAVYPETSANFTICPELEGYRVSVSFDDFELSFSGNVNQDDYLIVYDGTSEQNPVLGMFTENQLVGQTLSASNGNASGCLYFQFVAAGAVNTTSTGWSANISCSQPCVPPTANASIISGESDGNLWINCLYNEVQFSAAGSTAEEGSIVDYSWDFMDGEAVEMVSESIGHVYENPGIYDAVLTVYDELGCADNAIIHVGIIGAPEISSTLAPEVCIGSEVEVEGIYSPQTITNLMALENQIDLFIPDDQTQGYETQIYVSGFQAGTVLNSCDDLNGVYANMEHSYMGDLYIELICPNGQSVLLHEQGGSGLQLGEPVDDESTNPGIGYDYAWSDNSDLGIWAQYLGGQSLPAGVYAPIEPLCNLVGCPVNGIWTLAVYDLWAVDNGYIFSWGLSMETGINGAALEYTPVIDSNIESSYWSGEGVVSTSEDGDIALINTSEVGSIGMVYTTIDNAGCTYSESFQLEVINNPINVYLDEYFVYDETNISILASNLDPNPYYQVNWTWTPADGLANPLAAETEVFIPNDNGTYTVTATSNDLLGCVDSQSVTMVLPELVISGYIFLDENANGIFDAEEFPIPNFPFEMNNSGFISFSDQNGYYEAFTTYGSNTVSIDIDVNLWFATTPTSFTTTIDDGQNESVNNNFGFISNGSEQTVLNGDISYSTTFCLVQNEQMLSITNAGNTVPSGYIIYTYDPLCTYVSADPLPYQTDGNNLYFAFEDLIPYATESFQVILQMPNNGENGDVLYFSLQAYYNMGGADILVETDPYQSQLLCSYDPNYKTEMNGVGDLGIVPPNTTLDYVIHFQNTGTAPAMDVVITDELPEGLDYSSVQPVLASHPFVASVSPGGLLTVNFDDIMLPDSAASQLGSNGFIHFRVNQQPDLVAGTQIWNHASIFFDANSPIITEPKLNTVMSCTGEPLIVTLDESVLTIADMVSDVQWYFNGQLMLNGGYTLEVNQSGTYYAEALLSNGCPAVSEEFYVVGVDEIGGFNGMVYPNPASDVLFFNMPETVNGITIANALGQIVYESMGVKMKVLDISDWSTGAYMVRFTWNGQQRTMALLVE